MAAFAEDLHKLADGMRVKTRDSDRLHEEDAFRLAADPNKPRAPPRREAEVPYLNFAELDNAVERLRRSATAFDRVYARLAAAAPDPAAAPQRERINAESPPSSRR